MEANIKVQVFAVLKEFYDENFAVGDLQSIDHLKAHLIALKPEALNILNKSRFAINNKFVNNNTKINYGDTIYVMPPSSGG